MSGREAFSIDPETIAALLDGRLRGEERARVLAAIDASPELLAIVGDAAEIRELLGPTDRTETDQPNAPADTPAERSATISPPARPETNAPRLAFRRRPMWLFATLAAAAVVIVASVPLLVRRSRTDFSTPRIVAALAHPAATAAELPGDAWGTMRGVGDAASTDGHVVRIGARLADAQLLNAAGDTALRSVAAQIAALLETIPGAAIDAPTFRQLAATTPGAAAEGMLREGTAGAERELSPNELRAGTWLETARIASARGDTSFFSGAMNDNAKSAVLSAAQGPNHALADSLVAAISAPTRDMGLISNLSTRLLAALAR